MGGDCESTDFVAARVFDLTASPDPASGTSSVFSPNSQF